MPEPSLDRATTALGELATSVRALTTEVVQSESLRTRKIRVLQQGMVVMTVAIAVLVLLAITNFMLLSRVNQTAADTKSTNELLLGCFQPGTPCSQAGNAQATAQLDRVRQTQFVIAICQRQNPVDDDPLGIKMAACIKSYYPTFTLPAKPAK